MRTIELNNATYIIDEEVQKCTTVFPDGSKVDAVPMNSQLATALSLGYKDTWELTKFHDLLHQILAEVKGLDYSGVLWDVAHNRSDSPTHWIEEERVLNFQEVLNRLAQLGVISFLI